MSRPAEEIPLGETEEEQQPLADEEEQQPLADEEKQQPLADEEKQPGGYEAPLEFLRARINLRETSRQYIMDNREEATFNEFMYVDVEEHAEYREHGPLVEMFMENMTARFEDPPRPGDTYGPPLNNRYRNEHTYIRGLNGRWKPLDEEIDEYGHLPPEFSFPTFPLGYWPGTHIAHNWWRWVERESPLGREIARVVETKDETLGATTDSNDDEDYSYIDDGDDDSGIRVELGDQVCWVHGAGPYNPWHPQTSVYLVTPVNLEA
jgi:hypothetical protein